MKFFFRFAVIGITSFGVPDLEDEKGLSHIKEVWRMCVPNENPSGSPRPGSNTFVTITYICLPDFFVYTFCFLISASYFSRVSALKNWIERHSEGTEDSDCSLL